MSHDYVRIRYRGEDDSGRVWDGGMWVRGDFVVKAARGWLDCAPSVPLRLTHMITHRANPQSIAVNCLRRNVRFYDRAGKRLAARDIVGGEA